MDRLADILKPEIVWYAGSGRGANILLYPILDDTRHTYTVIALSNPRKIKTWSDDGAGIVVMARIVDDKIIIEVDNTDRPLYKSLMLAGIPREQIVMAYLGDEQIPEPMEVH